MIKQEAEAFLERNPRIRKELEGTQPSQLETLHLFGKAESEEDAKINLLEVLRALG